MNPTQSKYVKINAPTVSTQAATTPGNGAAPPKTGPSNFTPYCHRTKAYTAPRTANGQNITPTGNPSALNKGMTLAKRTKIEKAARLCATGLYTDKMIAEHLGITQPYLSVLKTTKEFQSASMAVLSGVLSETNEKMLASVEERREELAAMVPAALLQLRNLALSRNQNVALKACQEILDRDGQLAKVSKSSVELKTPDSMDAANKTATDILDILRPFQNTNPNTIQADPSGAVAPGFTISASQAKQQIAEMNEKINVTTLEEIDTASSTVQ